MKNLFNYIKVYGNKTFLEEEFNDIDSLILNSIVYIKFEKYLPKKKFEMRKLSDVASLYFGDYNRKQYKHSIIATDVAIKVLRAIKNTKRYKDIYLYNYVNRVKYLEQFGAITFKLTDDLIYVAFEGTDKYINSWEENFLMSYKFPIHSQKHAIRYLKRTIRFKDKNVIVGGHSKGGNLALVSAMYTKRSIRNKIIKIYSADGPGLRIRQFKSKRYKNIKDKYIHIIPTYSMVGLILRHENNYKVVKSSKFSVLSHDMTTWCINDKYLIDDELSNLSKNFDLYMQNFLDNNNDKFRKKYVKEVFSIFRSAEITNIEDIKANKLKNLRKIIKEFGVLDIDTRNMLLDFINFMIKNHSEEVKNKVINKLKIRT